MSSDYFILQSTGNLPKNKGGFINKKRTGHTDMRKGGMVLSTANNRKKK